MTVEDARKIAENSFPLGPETLAKQLAADVLYCPMTTRLGWCAQADGRIRIRINSNEAEGRQRFTLAHELAHVLLGTEPDALDLDHAPTLGKSAEESDADRLAGELLLPVACIRPLVALPLDARIVRDVAKKARVTPTMAATRIVSLHQELNIKSGGVFQFKGDVEHWRFCRGLSATKDAGLSLLRALRASPDALYRRTQKDGMVVTAFLVEGTMFPTICAQLLPPEVGTLVTRGERLAQLRSELFAETPTFQNSFGACVGPFAKRNRGRGEEVIDRFLNEYRHKPWYAILNTPEGREYLSLYLVPDELGENSI